MSSRTLRIRVFLTVLVASAGFGWYHLSKSPGLRTLHILCYSSFNKAWGPGPELIAKFKHINRVQVQVIEAEDAGLLLQKLKIAPADLVIGLDQMLLPEARTQSHWVTPSDLPAIDIQPDREFIPFDWAPIALVHRTKLPTPPTSLNDLLDSKFVKSLALQDPRTSTPGLQFLLWILDDKGVEEGFEYLQKLKPNVHSVSPSWSTAYGLFSKGIATLTLSYVTSPLYHLLEEKDDSVQAAIFPQGHPIQIEYAGIPAGGENRDLAEEFIRFMLSDEAQRVIMRKNYMLPVVGRDAQGTEWEKLPKFQVRPWKNLMGLLNQKGAILERWRKLEI